jgi:hypothetical protein
MIQGKDNERKKKARERTTRPKAGRYDRSMNRSSVRGREECCCRTITTVCLQYVLVLCERGRREDDDEQKKRENKLAK